MKYWIAVGIWLVISGIGVGASIVVQMQIEGHDLRVKVGLIVGAVFGCIGVIAASSYVMARSDY